MTCPGCSVEVELPAAHCGEKRCRRVASGGWHPNSAAAKLSPAEKAKLRRRMDRFNADSRAYEASLHRSNFGSYA